MALTYSNKIPLGIKAPDFILEDTISGKEMSFEEVKGSMGTVVMFICNHCPFVIHIREELIRLANDYQKMGIGFVAISSNDVVNYPQDSPKYMKELAESLNITFPYLFDETQSVAKDYDAACTPDFIVYDNNSKSVYRGQLDDSRPGNGIPNDGRSMREALDSLIEIGTIDPNGQKPSVGCGIKWK